MSKNNYVLHLENTERLAFNEIGKEICKHTGIEKIYLDWWVGDDRVENVYIVVVFKGGGLSVRNARANSLIANILELSKLLYGGYYQEVSDYIALKRKAEKQDEKETGELS